MILIDANLLIYAGVMRQPQHEVAHAWLMEQFEAGYPVGIPWTSLVAYLRVSTNPRLFQNPASVDAAMGQVEKWLKVSNVWVPGPGERHARIFAELLRSVNAQGNLVPDAHLAAIAIEHGLELCTADGDFARFEGLRWKNPLRQPLRRA